MPDALACLAASAAIAVSDIPFNGPISEVRVARVNGEFVVNPTVAQMANADIDLMVAATQDSVVMVEGEMKEVSEAEMLEAIKIGHEEIKKQCQLQLDLAAKVDKANPKREYSHEDSDEELYKAIDAFCYDKCKEIALEGIADKQVRKEKFAAVKEAFIATLTEEEAQEKSFLISQYFHKVEKEAVRDAILNHKVRLDGRKLNEIRPIWGEVDVLPGTHGSAVFTRGETQSLTSVTLGNKMDEQMVDGAVFEGSERFILHYNFPAFSTGEARPNRGPGRREVGHGNLALRALKPIIPTGIKNPYTIRIVSDILESNGSSSMATVCAGTLALMDAGIPIEKPVSGIAMGLISGDEGKYAVLSDILGDEDHLGDMDFKVTGTKDGITACQMDIKVNGLSYEILEEALNQAKEGRLHILEKMLEVIPEPREDYKPNAPRIIQMTIPKDMIGAVIGKGGEVIQKLQEETGTTIVIDEVEGVGVIDIVGNEKEGIDKAIETIKQITAIPEIGTVYKGKVKTITNFGAFVEFMPGKDGLLHISEIEWRRLNTVDEVLKEGDEIEVKLIGIDPKTGKFKLSRKVLLKKPEKAEN
jgi:polyribonucleotide nucleotidyltransferase